MANQQYKPEVLVVDDNARFLDSLAKQLSKGFAIRQASSADAARVMISPPPDAILIDLVLDEQRPEEKQGIDLLREFVQELPQIPVLIMTGYGDVDTAVKCLQLGAADFIEKGEDVRKLTVRLERALEKARLENKVGELESTHNMVGSSSSIRKVRQRIDVAARDSDVTVLIGSCQQL